MSVRARALISSRFASDSGAFEYQSPAGVRTIIDKFSVTNPTASSAALTVHIVTAGDATEDSNRIYYEMVDDGEFKNAEILQNQVLEPGDKIFVLASAADALVIRASGRQIQEA